MAFRVDTRWKNAAVHDSNVAGQVSGRCACRGSPPRCIAFSTRLLMICPEL